MDVEKTIEFLVGNAAQHDARLAAVEDGLIRLENSLSAHQVNLAAVEKSLLVLGDGLISLTGVVKSLSDQLAEHQQVTLEEGQTWRERTRSEEHTSELQSRPHLVCRLLL